MSPTRWRCLFVIAQLVAGLGFCQDRLDSPSSLQSVCQLRHLASAVTGAAIKGVSLPMPGYTQASTPVSPARYEVLPV